MKELDLNFVIKVKMMRSGHMNRGLITADGKDIAMSLGHDFCAEHEWGIDDINEMFGMKDSKAGIGKRKVRKLSESNVHFVESEEYVCLICSSKSYFIERTKDQLTVESLSGNLRDLFHVESLSSKHEDHNFQSGWSRYGFQVVAEQETPAGQFLKDFYQALQKKDAAIYLSKDDDNPFGRAGLKLAIISRVPVESLDHMRECDEDAIRLKQTSESTLKKTGLDKLKAYQDYYALSPRWTKENEQKDTKYKIIYWLNPFDQKSNESGWFTVEDLLLWTEGKGPIPKE